MLPIDPKDVVRGQYRDIVRGRRGPESDTETLIASKCSITLALGRRAVLPPHGGAAREGQRIISIAFREPPEEHVLR